MIKTFVVFFFLAVQAKDAQNLDFSRRRHPPGKICIIYVVFRIDIFL